MRGCVVTSRLVGLEFIGKPGVFLFGKYGHGGDGEDEVQSSQWLAAM